MRKWLWAVALAAVLTIVAMQSDPVKLTAKPVTVTLPVPELVRRGGPLPSHKLGGFNCRFERRRSPPGDRSRGRSCQGHSGGCIARARGPDRAGYARQNGSVTPGPRQCVRRNTRELTDTCAARTPDTRHVR